MINFLLNKHKVLIFLAIFLVTIVSCNSVPKEIPETLTAQELIQQGQNSFEKGNYKAALAYYNTVVDRYKDFPAIYIEARYEIAHLYMKQKKYDLAVPILNEIRDIYPKSTPGTLPAAYYKLAEIELSKIQKK